MKTEKLAQEMKQEEKKIHQTVKQTEDALKQLKKDVENHRNNKSKEDIDKMETALKQLKEDESRLKKVNKQTIKEIKKEVKIAQKSSETVTTSSIHDDLKNWDTLTPEKKL